MHTEPIGYVELTKFQRARRMLSWLVSAEGRRELKDFSATTERSPFELGVIEGIAPTLGQVSANEAKVLLGLASDVAPGSTIVEIGTLYGSATRILAMGAPAGCRVISVDNYSWNPHHIAADSHAALAQRVLRQEISEGRVELVRMDKNQYFATSNEPRIGLAFLDAIHSYEETLADIDWAISRNVNVVSGHDYSPLFPGVIRAVNERGGPRILVDTLWVL